MLSDGAQKMGLLSRRHNLVVLVSPHTPHRTIRTFSSAEYFSRVTRQIVRTVASTLSFFSAILPPDWLILTARSVSRQVAPDVPSSLTTYSRQVVRREH